MRKINEIILHCTATEQCREVSVAEIDSWHRARRFKCIGYHYVIHLDGRISVGRKESVVGAHCIGHNKNSIGVCYVGGLRNGKPVNTLNYKQINALRGLLAILMFRYCLSDNNVHLHSEYAKKDCPCFDKKYLRDVLLANLL